MIENILNAMDENKARSFLLYSKAYIEIQNEHTKIQNFRNVVKCMYKDISTRFNVNQRDILEAYDWLESHKGNLPERYKTLEDNLK